MSRPGLLRQVIQYVVCLQPVRRDQNHKTIKYWFHSLIGFDYWCPVDLLSMSTLTREFRQWVTIYGTEVMSACEPYLAGCTPAAALCVRDGHKNYGPLACATWYVWAHPGRPRSPIIGVDTYINWLRTQSSGAVWKSRWSSWAPRP